MIRLYQYPTVNPTATVKSDLQSLARAAGETPVPLVIFPEGTRTRDGEIRRFKRGGLSAILAQRKWNVWLATADGYWECAKLVHFREKVSTIRGRMSVRGPFPGPDPDASPEEIEAFIDEMQATMQQNLDALRNGGSG